ncbi:MAG: SPOR domain-containing protein [Bacteroidota bacterium]|nr:SPOR domain-containing protein [Bacteroidota bacterium]MDE2832958.1 SPOR domain-containing protein [Bacteroidota bacterium]MDE2958314.1 SPOR domain-containing protein [Bacteroidota bacterium]
MTVHSVGLYPALALVCVAIVLPGCSQLSSSAGSDSAQAEPGTTPVNWADYEDFNADRYREDPPSARPEVIHDAPAELLTGGGIQGQASGQQSGFRISIFSTLESQQADRATAEAIAWWQELERDEALADIYTTQEWEPPVYQDYRAPYYRVRIGNFASREDAQRMLALVEDRYPNAFIVPDQVVIR